MNIQDSTFTSNTCTNHQAKVATRERTFRNVQDMAQWHPDGYLTRDWADLCGFEDETLKMLLDAKALHKGHGKYLGINNDPKVTLANTAYFKGAIAEGLAEFRTGTWNTLINDAWAQRTNILTFDAFTSVARKDLSSYLGPTVLAVKDRRERYGQAMLYLNLSTRGADSLQTKREAYGAELSKLFGLDIPPDQIVVYTSKKVPMLSVWLRFGY